jgi:hypothetical protein
MSLKTLSLAASLLLACSSLAAEISAVQLGTGNFPVDAPPGTAVYGTIGGLYAVQNGMSGVWVNATGQTVYIKGGYFSPLGSYGAIFDYSGSLTVRYSGQPDKFVADFTWDHYSLPNSSVHVPFEIPQTGWISVPPSGLLFLTAHATAAPENPIAYPIGALICTVYFSVGQP